MDEIKEKDSFDSPAKVVLRKGVTEDDLLPVKPLSVRVKEAFSKKGFKKFLLNNFPHKGDKTPELIRKLIMDISFCCLLVAGCYLIFYYSNYRETAIRNINVIEAMNEESLKYEDYDEKQLASAWLSIKKEYPDIEFPEGMNITFARLYAINQDIVGRLSIPGTNIDTAVLQTTNNSYYLNRNFYGETSRYGEPFGNYSCSFGSNGLSKNTIIYGHNTHDGLMFHQLEKYMKIDGYRESPIIRFDSLYETTYWKVFGVILTNATSDLDNGNVFNCLYSEYSSQNEFMYIISGIAKRSMIHTSVDVKSTDKIMSLYTCYQSVFKGGRLIVFARQVRDGESTYVDTSSAYFNSNALYPQAYYDAINGYNKTDDTTSSDVNEEAQDTVDEISDSVADITEDTYPVLETAEGDVNFNEE